MRSSLMRVCSQRECHNTDFLFSNSYFTEFLDFFKVFEYFCCFVRCVNTVIARCQCTREHIALINETKRFTLNLVIIRLPTIQHRIDSRWNSIFFSWIKIWFFIRVQWFWEHNFSTFYIIHIFMVFVLFVFLRNKRTFTLFGKENSNNIKV